MKKIGILFCLCFLSCVCQAQDADMRAVVDRMDRIERDLTMLQRKIYKENAGTTENSVQVGDSYLYEKLVEMDRQTKELTAELENVRFEIKQLAEKTQKAEKDMSVRFELLEKQVSELKTEAIKKEVKEKTVEKKGAKEAYENAYNLLNNDQFEAAQNAFEAFLKDYPTDGLADNAKYWLGETFYARRQYDKAAVAFADGMNKKSTKGADCLLKLGMSMMFLNKKEEACAAFQSLASEFPKASEILKTKAKSEAKKLSCP